jgi:transposase
VLTDEVYFNVGMAEPYDEALRERAVAAYEAGKGGSHDLGALFKIGYRTVERWVAKKRATGSVAADPKRGGWHSRIEMPTLLAVVGEAPDSTLAELCWEYNRRVAREQRSTPTSIGRALHRAGFVFKKNGRGRASATGRMWQRSERRS